MIKKAFIFFVFIFSLNVFAQNDNGTLMKSFIPKSNVYDIYYPQKFSLSEDNQGIVNIYDETSKLNITISSYPIDKKMDDTKIIELLSEFIKSYYHKELEGSDWNSYNTKFEILVESKFLIDKTNWIWYGIVDNQKLIVFSVNKDTSIEQDEQNLIQYMINSLIINK